MAIDFGNVLTGAGSGAYMGSSFGPAGTLFGAGAGALTGLFGSKKKRKKVDTLDKEQRALYNQKVQGLRGEGPFADMYKFNAQQFNDVFDANVSRPAYRSFQENIVPSITGQFRGGNLQNSTYTGEALSRAGRDVQESLNAQRAAMAYQGQQDAYERQNRGINDIMNQHTFDYENAPMSPIDQILSTVGPRAGDWFADNYLSKGLK